MTTLIIGAHGQVGQHIVQQLAATGKPSTGDQRTAAIKSLGGQARMFDLMGTADAMVPAMNDVTWFSPLAPVAVPVTT